MRSIKMQEKKPKCYLPYEYIDNSNYTESSFYKNMFIEDIINNIIPISLKRNENECKAILDCSENDLNLIKNIFNSFNRTYRDEYNINRLILNTIKEIARNISWYGEAIYKICKISDDDIKMIGLIPDNFINLKFFYIQLPPKNNKMPLYPKTIPNKLLWKISIPQILQKNYSFKTILSHIDQFDSFMPKSIKNDFYQGNNIPEYDHKEYAKKRFLYVNELTKGWGWDQRQWTSNDKTTEFFNLYKRLKFQSSIAVFREHIISELNSLFFKLKIDAKIKLENIISSDEYKEKMKTFLNGQLSYNEIIEFLY